MIRGSTAETLGRRRVGFLNRFLLRGIDVEASLDNSRVVRRVARIDVVALRDLLSPRDDTAFLLAAFF